MDIGIATKLKIYLLIYLYSLIVEDSTRQHDADTQCSIISIQVSKF